MRGALASLALAGALLAGCAPAHPPRTVRVAIALEPHSLNPDFSTLVVENEIAGALFQGLVRIGRGERVVPDVAQALPSRANGGISADELTYTYRLRTDARWSDGVPVTADDVVFTYGVLTDPKLDVPNDELAALVASVRARGAHAVVIRLRHRSVDALRLLFCNGAHGSILPAHVLRGVDLNRTDFDRRPVGSGPFVLARWTPGVEVRLAARRAAGAPPPRLDDVRLLVIPVPTTAVAALRAGEIDYARLPPSFDARLLGDGLVTGIVHGRTLVYLSFATQRAPFRDVRLRRALAAVLDRDRIGRAATTGFTTPARTLVPPDEPGYVAPAGVPRTDLAAARGALAALHPHPLVLTLSAGSPSMEARAAQIADAWERAGVRVQLRALAPAVMFGDPGPLYEGTYEVALTNWTFGPGSDRSDQLASWARAPKGENFAQYADPQVDRWCVQAVQAPDERTRAAARAAIANRVARDVPYVPIDWPLGRYARTPRLHGVAPQPDGEDLWNLAEWRIDSDHA